jgi:hypothetical protein
LVLFDIAIVTVMHMLVTAHKCSEDMELINLKKH